MSEQTLVRARTVHHIRIDSGRPYAQFRADYETVVPSFDRLEAIGVVKSNAGWTAIEGLSDATAIHGLVNFFTFDPSPVMKLRGNTGHAVTYLAGNIVKAEPGFRIDPATFLYVPLRIVIAETDAGTGEMSFDHPADLFAVYGNPELDSVSHEFTETLGGVLSLLGLDVPRQLAGASR
jgi:uncharacterized protein (DUF302 family)